VLAALVAVLVLATAAGMVLLRAPAGSAPPAAQAGTERVKATITGLQQVPCGGGGFEDELVDAGYAPGPSCAEVTIRIDEGPDTGDNFTTITGDPNYRTPGQAVVLLRGTDPDLPAEARYQLTDVQRAVPLLALAGIFLVSILALGRLRGALAVVGLGASLVVLVQFLVPALLAGRPPVITAVVGASAVMVVVMLLAHGPSIRTATAMVGTGAALLLTVLLATVFVERAGLSGVSTDEAAFVQAMFGDVDVRGLLLAGIVIGALGILDDVTITQVSAVYELRAADPRMPRRRLYSSALRVGRDHIAATVNTLLLAYAGASMPLLVIFATSGVGLVDTVTNGIVAEEVVRTLVGSVGLIAAVPITTALAALMCPPAAATVEGEVEAAATPPTTSDDVLARGHVPTGGRFFDEAAWAARARRRDTEPT
jgi:uncharacterized membrane protein